MARIDQRLTMADQIVINAAACIATTYGDATDQMAPDLLDLYCQDASAHHPLVGPIVEAWANLRAAKRRKAAGDKHHDAAFHHHQLIRAVHHALRWRLALAHAAATAPAQPLTQQAGP